MIDPDIDLELRKHRAFDLGVIAGSCETSVIYEMSGNARSDLEEGLRESTKSFDESNEEWERSYWYGYLSAFERGVAIR